MKKYLAPAIVILVLVSAKAYNAAERNRASGARDASQSRGEQADRTKLCAMLAEEMVPALYGDVEKWGVSRAIAAWETSRDEARASGDPQQIERVNWLQPFVPGMFKHVAAAHSVLDRFEEHVNVSGRQQATSTYMTSCLLLGPENVK